MGKKERSEDEVPNFEGRLVRCGTCSKWKKYINPINGYGKCINTEDAPDTKADNWCKDYEPAEGWVMPIDRRKTNVGTVT